MTRKMTRSAALKIARHLTGKLYKIGGQYCYDYAIGPGLYTTSNPSDYWRARASRSDRIADIVNVLLGEQQYYRRVGAAADPSEWMTLDFKW